MRHTVLIWLTAFSENDVSNVFVSHSLLSIKCRNGSQIIPLILLKSHVKNQLTCQSLNLGRY